MTEPCGWCKGAGHVTATANFLLARLRADQADDYRWIGASANALVIAAITGEEPKSRPFDGWDLGRCLITRSVAPAELRERMHPIVESWIADMRAEKEASGRPFYGVEDAQKMHDEHVEAVRALVLACGEERAR
jgi:hypothetical protein